MKTGEFSKHHSYSREKQSLKSLYVWRCRRVWASSKTFWVDSSIGLTPPSTALQGILGTQFRFTATYVSRFVQPPSAHDEAGRLTMNLGAELNDDNLSHHRPEDLCSALLHEGSSPLTRSEDGKNEQRSGEFLHICSPSLFSTQIS